MNDIKKKLEQVEAYKVDTSAFKADLKAKLLTEYRAQQNAKKPAEVAKKPSFYSWTKMISIPVMAVLVLGVFVTYEYMSKPMTAYAYLEKVKANYDQLNSNGVEITTIHKINGSAVEITSIRDSDGDLRVQVEKDGVEVEHFVVDDGSLFVANAPERSRYVELGYEEEAVTEGTIEELTSIVNSIVLAETANPFADFEDLVEREDLELEQDGSTTKITYEELNDDGEVIVYEHQFEDFMPVKRVSYVKPQPEAPVIAQHVEVVEYEAVVPTVENVERELLASDFKPFIENEAFTAQVETMISENLDDLVEEYEAQEDKRSYIAVWETAPRDIALVEREDVSLEEIGEDLSVREIEVSVDESGEAEVVESDIPTPRVVELPDTTHVVETPIADIDVPQPRVIAMPVIETPELAVPEISAPSLKEVPRIVDVPEVRTIDLGDTPADKPTTTRIVHVPTPTVHHFDEVEEADVIAPTHEVAPTVVTPTVKPTTPTVISTPTIKPVVDTPTRVETVKVVPTVELRDSLVRELADELIEAEEAKKKEEEAKKKAAEEAARQAEELKRQQQLEEERKKAEAAKHAAAEAANGQVTSPTIAPAPVITPTITPIVTPTIQPKVELNPIEDIVVPEIKEKTIQLRVVPTER